MARVGIIGLGLIGMALAERLSDHDLIGHDIDPGRAEAFPGSFVPAEAVWSADIILASVFDTDQLVEVVANAPEGPKVLVSLSTCDPDRIAALSVLARAKGITLVEAPISGTSRQVREGTALLLLAGDPEGLAVFETIAGAISASRRHVGAIGNGNRMKLAINCVLGLNRAALAEGVVFAQAVGLDPAVFLETALDSAARSEVMHAKGPAMVAGDFTPLGRITQSAKDFNLIQEMAARHGHGGLPMVARYRTLMADAIAAGEGDLDNAAVLLPIERAAKAEPL